MADVATRPTPVCNMRFWWAGGVGEGGGEGGEGGLR